MKPIQLPLGVRLRDDATFANYYPGANAAALGYVERLCEVEGEGISGAILGRALYEGKLDVRVAQARADERNGPG